MKISLFGKELMSFSKDGVSLFGKNKAMSYSQDWFTLSQWDVVINKNQLYYFYKHNKTVRRCNGKIAGYIGSRGYVLRDINGDEVEHEKAPEEYEFIRNILKAPTEHQMKIEMCKHLLTCGELYLLPTTDLAGKINGFQIIHPKTVTKIVQDGKIVRFLQWNGVKKKEYYANKEDAPNPLQVMSYYQYEKDVNNELNGMGVLDGMIYDLLSDNEASKRNYRFFENDSTPPIMIMIEKDMTPEQVALLAEEIEFRNKGSNNAHRPFLGIGVKDIKPISLSPKDMEFINTKKMTKEDVCLAFWVPKAILGVTEDVNYNNAVEMKKEFVWGTVNHIQDLLQHIINDFILNFVEDFPYELDFNEIEVYDETQYQELLMKKVNTGMITLNEARTESGKDEYVGIPEADKPMVSRSMILLEDIMLDPIINTTWS